MSFPPAVPPDISLVQDAIMDRLRSDSLLRSICPDGVWWDTADEKSKRFIVVASLDADDRWVFGGRAWEDSLLLIKAVMLNSSGGSVKQAAVRIDALLEKWQADIPGFGHLSMSREEPVRYTERDSENTAIRWLHRGGHYRVHAAIAAD